MHDGRFETLEEVIEFYSDDIQNHPNLDPILRAGGGGPGGGGARRLNFNDQEQAALIAFLNTLTDETFINDPKFADPFVEVVSTPNATVTPTELGATPTPRPELNRHVYLPILMR